MSAEKLKSFRGGTQSDAEKAAKDWAIENKVKVIKAVSTCLTEEAGTPQARQMWHTHLHYEESSN
jgi:hypothetical protein